eukprot:c9174_g1_i1 orf=416-673(-)
MKAQMPKNRHDRCPKSTCESTYPFKSLLQTPYISGCQGAGKGHRDNRHKRGQVCFLAALMPILGCFGHSKKEIIGFPLQQLHYKA